jgi:hypothetical protein
MDDGRECYPFEFDIFHSFTFEISFLVLIMYAYLFFEQMNARIQRLVDPKNLVKIEIVDLFAILNNEREILSSLKS